jgi:hypothetical protein
LDKKVNQVRTCICQFAVLNHLVSCGTQISEEAKLMQKTRAAFNNLDPVHTLIDLCASSAHRDPFHIQSGNGYIQPQELGSVRFPVFLELLTVVLDCRALLKLLGINESPDTVLSGRVLPESSAALTQFSRWRSCGPRSPGSVLVGEHRKGGQDAGRATDGVGLSAVHAHGRLPVCVVASRAELTCLHLFPQNAYAKTVCEICGGARPAMPKPEVRNWFPSDQFSYHVRIGQDKKAAVRDTSLHEGGGLKNFTLYHFNGIDGHGKVQTNVRAAVALLLAP